MDVEGIVLSEISQRDKDKYCMISLICGIYKTQQTSEQNKKRSRLTNIEYKPVVTSGEREEGRGKSGAVVLLKVVKNSRI